MAAVVLDGAQYAAQIRSEVARGVAELAQRGPPIRLCAILVGDDEPSRLYAASQQRQCTQVGIQYELRELPAQTTQAELLAHIDRLNGDPSVTGVILQLPLPPGLDSAAAQFRIDPYKDVEGVSPANIGLLFYGEPIIAPCTALAVNELLRRSGVKLRGVHAVVVGQSRIVGKPVTMFLLGNEATVTACNIHTVDLPGHTRRGDVLIVAIGRPRTIGPQHVKPGAVVIDVGINTVTQPGPDGRPVRCTVGDVDFEAVRQVAGAISPVPGGVGPLTVAMLLRNTLEAARKQRDRA